MSATAFEPSLRLTICVPRPEAERVSFSEIQFFACVQCLTIYACIVVHNNVCVGVGVLQ